MQRQRGEASSAFCAQVLIEGFSTDAKLAGSRAFRSPARTRWLSWATCSGEIYLSFSCSHVFGCHSRANRWASAICEAAICSASLSLPDR